MSMERSTITMSESGNIIIPDNVASIWMSEPELVELFGVIVPTLRAAIKAVYRSGVLKPYEAERYIKLPNGYGMDVYALPMVVALAFRINSPCVYKVRNALLEKLCLRKKKTILWTFMHDSAYEC